MVPVTPSSARFSAGTPYLRGLVRPGLQVGLVELDDVGPGREQVLDLLVDRLGVAEGRLLGARVVVVLGLLGHGERARHGDLDGPAGVRAQELQVSVSTAWRRRIGPTIRGTGFGCPLRSSAVPGLSMSTPSSAVANRLE